MTGTTRRDFLNETSDDQEFDVKDGKLVRAEREDDVEYIEDLRFDDL